MQLEMQPKPFWHPLWAGIALGVVLLLTFLITQSHQGRGR